MLGIEGDDFGILWNAEGRGSRAVRKKQIIIIGAGPDTTL